LNRKSGQKHRDIAGVAVNVDFPGQLSGFTSLKQALLGAALVLTIAGGLAGLLPAFRASSVNPTTALRQE
jgi:ABC-type lipoprotein release transport system permease subunit